MKSILAHYAEARSERL
jgi:CRP/FNR family cyclic AMP-dependent transcriptional regulator